MNTEEYQSLVQNNEGKCYHIRVGDANNELRDVYDDEHPGSAIVINKALYQIRPQFFTESLELRLEPVSNDQLIIAMPLSDEKLGPIERAVLQAFKDGKTRTKIEVEANVTFPKKNHPLTRMVRIGTTGECVNTRPKY